MIDLDALERLAAAETPDAATIAEYAQKGWNWWWTENQSAFELACDPVTVSALVRAVKAALIVNEQHLLSKDWGDLDELGAALAPFAPETGEAAAQQTTLGVARVAGSVAQENSP